MPPQPPDESTEFPDELARLPKGRHGLPPEFVAHNQRERLIAAFTAVVAASGYEDTTITAITEGAGVSSGTFYKYFATIEECYAAAFDAALARFGAILIGAYDSESEWPLRVRAALAAWLDFLAGDPDVARLLTAEPFVAGPVIAERYKDAIDRATPYLSAGREQRPAGAEPLPATTERGLLGAVNSLVSRQVKAGRAEDLRDLLPDLVQFALTPYLGAAEARRVATLP
ncbi:MAG TPA: TetR/AcrR family transcriptional regulator [Solirubrobacterales bacterium]|nr:TetR/AcrR family transcriptional regulator [Solirubrobacterales bacterium]